MGTRIKNPSLYLGLCYINIKIDKIEDVAQTSNEPQLLKKAQIKYKIYKDGVT